MESIETDIISEEGDKKPETIDNEGNNETTIVNNENKEELQQETQPEESQKTDLQSDNKPDVSINEKNQVIDSKMKELEEQYQKVQATQLKLKYDKELFDRQLPEEITDFLDYSSPENCEKSFSKMMKLVGLIIESKFPDIMCVCGSTVIKAAEPTTDPDTTKIRKVFNL